MYRERRAHSDPIVIGGRLARGLRECDPERVSNAIAKPISYSSATCAQVRMEGPCTMKSKTRKYRDLHSFRRYLTYFIPRRVS